tara:strand:+ start:6271 stop:6612 length:342 start_codon:yes stop_codon:yes gene_type:complete
MADRRSGSPQSIRDLISRLKERPDIRLGIRLAASVDAVEAVLPEVLGADLAGRCRIGSIIGTVVTIECRSSAAAQRVQFSVPGLLKRVRLLLDNEDVSEFRVIVDMEGWSDLA